jgi:N-acetylmuramoyl-L-alanine amidase
VDKVSEYSAFLLPNPYRLIIDIHGKRPTTQTAASQPAPAEQPKPAEAPKTTEVKKAEEKGGVIKATSEPTSKPTFEAVTPREVAKAEKPEKKEPKERVEKGSEKGETEKPVIRAAKPAANGETSLIRALGLKINRIVIDAGHGGHDTGTIGAHGLEEKELVLDVALRLGKILESRMGAEVIYTRDDDTFVPLENRTAYANQHQADLFISIHANSSRNKNARGIETYYLNFTSSADALEVAARENAVSEKSIYELQDLVKQITLSEKIEESREFASRVQQALHSNIARKDAGLKNRGVKQAPFVVLIGANMPSILAEISFISNPGDAKKLKTADYRQKIADSLYKGMASYVDGLSGVTVASKSAKSSGR